jgi:hypothetical protein
MWRESISAGSCCARTCLHTLALPASACQLVRLSEHNSDDNKITVPRSAGPTAAPRSRAAHSLLSQTRSPRSLPSLRAKRNAPLRFAEGAALRRPRRLQLSDPNVRLRSAPRKISFAVSVSALRTRVSSWSVGERPDPDGMASSPWSLPLLRYGRRHFRCHIGCAFPSWIKTFRTPTHADAVEITSASTRFSVNWEVNGSPNRRCCCLRQDTTTNNTLTPTRTLCNLHCKQ